MKKGIALLAAVTMCATLFTSGFGAAAEETEASGSVSKIAVVFATGGLGDKTYNDSLYYGVKEICDSRGYEMEYSESIISHVLGSTLTPIMLAISLTTSVSFA